MEGRDKDRDNSGVNLLGDEAEKSLLKRISVLQRTRESTRGAEGGQLLTSNIDKQIQRVRSELDSFLVPSRDSSVIRCSSTPERGERGQLTFGAVENCPHSQVPLEDISSQEENHPSFNQPQFQIYLDNPLMLFNT